MRLVRKKFKIYLGSLQLDAPFCKDKNCPIAQYFLDVHSRNVDVGGGVMNETVLPMWAGDFVYEIDRRLGIKEPHGESFWTDVTPSLCLEILEK